MGIFDFFKKPKDKKAESIPQKVPAAPPVKEAAPPKEVPPSEEFHLPPLGPYISEFYIHTTSKIVDYLLSIVEIHDGDELIDFPTAIERYYSDPKIYFPWEFHFKTVRIESKDKEWVILGDDHIVGWVPKLAKDELESFSIDEIMERFTIDHMDCDIKLDRYFRLSEAQYKQYVKEDKYNRGFASWAGKPKAKLLVYYK